MKTPKIIAIANQKGGVGKTTTAFNFAASLSQSGYRVLLVDFDPQANLSDYVGYISDGEPDIGHLMQAVANRQPFLLSRAIRRNEKERVDYIPASVLLSSAEMFLSTCYMRERVLKKILRDESLISYDYILIDCLPSLGVLLINALTAADSVLIPVQAQKFALDGIALLLEIIHMVQENLNEHLTIEGVLLTMADNTNMSASVSAELSKMFGEKIYINAISRSVEATMSTHQQASLVAKGGKLGKQYRAAVDELLERQG